MSILAGLNVATDVVEDKDTLGGGSRISDSGAYEAVVQVAYLSISSGGANALNIVAKLDSGKEYKETIYFTSGTKKGCKTFYEDKDGAKHNLPGYTLVNDLCLLGTEKPLQQQETDEKVVKVWDYEAKADVPKKVTALTDLQGATVCLGILKQKVDKNAKDDNGDYHPTGEFREENVISKVFVAEDHRTVTECKAKATEGAFINDWKEKYDGKTIDKTSDAGKAMAKNKPAQGSAPATPSAATSGMFSNNG